MRADAPATEASFLRALPSLLLLALTMASGFTMMGAFGTVQESAKAELALTDTAMGLIQGVAVAIPLVLLSMPIGVLVDRRNRVRLLAIMAAVWTAGTALTAAAGTLAVLFAARMLVGIGTTGALTAALSLTADWCAPQARGRATLIVSLGKAIGIGLAFAAAGALFGLFSGPTGPRWFAGIAAWRSVHVVLSIASALLLLPLLILREPARREVATGSHASLAVVTAELWRRRAFLIPVFVGQASVVMADTAAVIWAAPVLSRLHHLRPDQFAGWMGLLVFGTNLVGTVIGGIAADLGQRSERRGGLLVGAVIAALVGVPAALFPLAGSVGLFAAALGTLALAGAVTSVIVSVALTVLIPNELRGFCIGAFIAVAGLVGYGIAPPLVAVVSGWMGGEAMIGRALGLVGVVVGIISVLAFAAATRHAPAAAASQPV